MAKSKKLDIKRYLSETEKDAALQEYILNHPELVEKSIKEFIHETVQYTCRDISYNSTLAANKKYAEFKNKFFAVVETELEKILAAPDLFDSLLGDINYRELLTKELKDIFRPSSYQISQIIQRGVVDAVPTRLIAIMETDPVIKKFNDEVKAALRARIAETTVEAEVNRLMGRR